MTNPSYRPSTNRVPCGACLIVRDDNDRVLMLRRTGAHGEGLWAPPGGWCEPGEDPARTAIREAWEEVGIKVKTVEYLGYTTDSHPEGLHGITLWFGALAWTGTARNTNPDRITEVEWWSIEKLDTALRFDAVHAT